MLYSREKFIRSIMKDIGIKCQIKNDALFILQEYEDGKKHYRQVLFNIYNHDIDELIEIIHKNTKGNVNNIDGYMHAIKFHIIYNELEKDTMGIQFHHVANLPKEGKRKNQIWYSYNSKSLAKTFSEQFPSYDFVVVAVCSSYGKF